MKIISLGLDNSALDPNSPLAGRLCEYGEFIEAYSVFVPYQQDLIIDLSKTVKVYGVGGRNKVVQLVRLYKQAAALVRAQPDSIITVQDLYYLGLVGVILKLRYHRPLEIQIHGFEKETWWRKWVARLVVLQASKVRVVSKRLESEIISIYGVAPRKIVVIPIYSPAAHQLNPPKDYQAHQPFVFLTVGRLVPVKNISLQIKALAEVVKQHPEVRLVVAGEGPDRGRLASLIQSLNIENHVIFMGQVDDVAGVYKQADAFILTSISEGWGLAVIEAASFGLPIIMTDVGCAGEVIKNEESGLVVANPKITTLVSAMSLFIQDKSLRARLGGEAKVVVQKLPSKAEIYNLYRQAWAGLV